MILGVSAATSELSLKDHTGALICNMDNNEAMLGAYPVEDFLELYVRLAATFFLPAPYTRVDGTRSTRSTRGKGTGTRRWRQHRCTNAPMQMHRWKDAASSTQANAGTTISAQRIHIDRMLLLTPFFSSRACCSLALVRDNNRR